MPKSTNAYLRYLPAVFAFALIPFILSIVVQVPGWFVFSPVEPKSIPLLWKYVFHLGASAPGLAIVWLLSRHFGRPEVGWWSCLMFLIPVLLSVYSWGTGEGSGSPFVLLLVHLSYGIPYFVWGVLMLRDRRAWLFAPFLFWGLSAVGISNGARLFNSFQTLSFEVAVSNGFTYISPLAFLPVLILPVLLLVLLGATYAIAVAGVETFRSRRLDLANRYTKWEALALFYTFRLIILFGAWGAAGVVGHLSPQFDSVRPSMAFMSKPVLYAYLIGGLLLFLLVLYLYRKFLLEFFFQHGKVPSYYYWLLQTPVFDLVLFPIGLIVLRPAQQPVPYQTFTKSWDDRFSRAENIRLVLVIGQVLVVGLGLWMLSGTPNALAVGSLLIGAILNVLYLYNHRMLGVLFGLLLLWALISPLLQSGTSYYGERFILLSDVSRMALGFAFFYALSGVLYIREFETDDVPEQDTEQVILDSFVPTT
jgi:hypothetical protein